MNPQGNLTSFRSALFHCLRKLQGKVCLKTLILGFWFLSGTALVKSCAFSKAFHVSHLLNFETIIKKSMDKNKSFTNLFLCSIEEGKQCPRNMFSLYMSGVTGISTEKS